MILQFCSTSETSLCAVTVIQLHFQKSINWLEMAQNIKNAFCENSLRISFPLQNLSPSVNYHEIVWMQRWALGTRVYYHIDVSTHHWHEGKNKFCDVKVFNNFQTMCHKVACTVLSDITFAGTPYRPFLHILHHNYLQP